MGTNWKTILSAGLLWSIAQFASAQGVGINEDNSIPDNSAVLDVSSTEKGMLVPRMTAEQKEAIISPANGLLVYQTDGSAPGFWYFDGSTWVQAIGPAGAPGAPGAAAGSNAITHISANTANISWLQCYTHCLGLEADAVSPIDATVFNDWRMPSPSEVYYYKNTFAPPAAGWLGSNISNYVWTTDQHITDGNNNGWYTMNESGSWNGNTTNSSMKCRCVRSGLFFLAANPIRRRYNLE